MTARRVCVRTRADRDVRVVIGHEQRQWFTDGHGCDADSEVIDGR